MKMDVFIVFTLIFFLFGFFFPYCVEKYWVTKSPYL
jgi:hypothetical protein